jgi:hypothetical protein
VVDEKERERKSARKNLIYDFHFSINLALIWGKIGKDWGTRAMGKRRGGKNVNRDFNLYRREVDSFE